MSAVHAVEWRLRTHTIDTRNHTLIMGILNVTPDSFSDGGDFDAGGSIDHDRAVEHALQLVGHGADIIDVGGESTRPGADSVPAHTEAARVLPVVAALAAEGVVVSIDTSKPEVAEAALDAGAEIVNDVTGLRNPDMVAVCGDAQPGVVVMHMRGTPRSMQDDPVYDDVVGDVREAMLRQAEVAVACGVGAEQLCIDPGIGFGKTVDHNLLLLQSLHEFTRGPFPVLVGVSRKSFIGTVLAQAGVETTPRERDRASAAVAALAVAGGATVVRVHDVAATLESTRIADAIVRGSLQI
jgi:dihydropteroate synthase